jgi:hypothetical protein
MKIIVKSFLTLRSLMNNQAAVEIEEEEITIQQVLDKVIAMFGEDFEMLHPIEILDEAYADDGLSVVLSI